MNDIKHVKKFIDLGSILEKEDSSQSEIEKTTADGRRVIGMLNSVLWSKNILYRIKKLIYKATVESIMLYGSELLATEMDYRRRSKRMSTLEKNINVEIRKEMCYR